jgi:hypothetical protein
VRNILVAVLALSVCGSPALAQSLRGSTHPLRDSIVREAVSIAQQSGQAKDNPIPPGYLWTGIGLLAGGGLNFAIGAAYSDPCSGIPSSLFVCEDSTRKLLFTVGAALAGAGAIVLWAGNNKRNAELLPAVTLTRGGIALQSRVSFGSVAR